MRRITAIIIVLAFAIQFFACASMNKTTKGAAVGTTAGAALGGVIGKQAGNTALGAILGAVVGGAAGAYIGHRMDKQAEEIQKELANAEVNRVGEGIQITFDGSLLFDTGKSLLHSQAQTDLSKLAETLNRYSDTNLLIEGHADSQGEADYNQTLSEQRASAVASYLARNNIAMSRLTTKGYGESQPKASNDTREGRAANRRVELVIVANENLKKEAATKAKP